MPAATTAAHVARPCAAQAQRHAPAKQRRKRQRPVRSAQHAARALTIAKAEIGPIATVRMVTAPIQIAHGPTARLAIALIGVADVSHGLEAFGLHGGVVIAGDEQEEWQPDRKSVV